MALYNSTNGANWNVGWPLSDPLDTWPGVHLNAQGCVDILDLDGDFDPNTDGGVGNNLNGVLPPEIGNLTELTALYLNDNAVSGTLPDVFANFYKLKILDLSDNNYLGSIPGSLGQATALTNLNLSGNRFTGNIPASLGFLN